MPAHTSRVASLDLALADQVERVQGLLLELDSATDQLAQIACLFGVEAYDDTDLAGIIRAWLADLEHACTTGVYLGDVHVEPLGTAGRLQRCLSHLASATELGAKDLQQYALAEAQQLVAVQ